MTDMFTLDVFEEDVFQEDLDFAKCLEEMNEYLIEAATYRPLNMPKIFVPFKAIGTAWKNTADTTKQAAGVYGNLTDAGGSMMKAVYDMIMAGMSLISRVIKFIFTNLSRVPAAIAKALHRLENIPSSLMAKVRGDISLYITKDDMELLTRNILAELNNFLLLSTNSLDKNGMFLSFTRGTSAIGHYNDMHKIYTKVSKIGFKLSIIQMNTPEVVNTYLRSDSAYYTLVKTALTKLSEMKPELEKYEQAAGQKFNDELMKGRLNNLSAKDLEKARDMSVMMSNVIAIIGNLLMYIKHDIAVIDQTTNKLLKLAENNNPKNKKNKIVAAMQNADTEIKNNT